MSAEFHNPIEACRYALQNFPGSIVEIGAGLGETTKHLLALAAEFDRQVIVIDPFEHGWKDMPESYGRPYTLEGFHANVKHHKDRLELHQVNSLSEEARKICSGPIAFAFIDGLQYYGAVMNDLNITGHAKIVCVDDMDRLTSHSEVPIAVERYIKFYEQDDIKHLIIKNKWAFII